MTRLVVNAAWPRDAALRPAAAAARVAEAGAHGLGLPDSPRLFDDPFVSTERVLEAGDVPLAGPCVLALGLRHPATVAAGLTALADDHGERVFAVLARGESAVRNEALPVPSLRDYCRAVDGVVERLRGNRPLLLGAGSGPRTIAETAARVDGVLVDVGADPAVVAAAIAHARGANPDARVWLFLRALATDDAGERVGALAPLLGSCAARLTAAPDWYRVPEALRPDVATLAARHDYGRHGTSAAAADGPQLPGAGAFVAERFFVVGTAEQVSTRMAALAALGVDGVVLSGAVGGFVTRLDATVGAVRSGIDRREAA